MEHVLWEESRWRQSGKGDSLELRVLSGQKVGGRRGEARGRSGGKLELRVVSGGKVGGRRVKAGGWLEVESAEWEEKKG